MKSLVSELASNQTEKVRDAVIGLGGSGLAFSLQGWQSAAAIFAGTTTGLWMLTQIILAIRASRRSRKKTPERDTF